MSKQALITGGAGFLGPHLIRRLLQEGWRVAALDNFFAGKRSHLEPFAQDSNFVFFEGDLTDAGFVRQVLKTSRPEIIFHLAAIHFIPYCMRNPRETVHVNVTGAQTLLDALETAPVSRFIFASTGDVYLASDRPHAETDPLGPTNIYGISKIFGEQLIGLAGIRHPHIHFMSARFFNIYGPGETNPHLFPDILGCLKNGRVLRLGNMEPQRDYIFVEDVAEALYRLSFYEGREVTFNLGTGTGASVRQVLDILEQLLGSPLEMETDPAKIRKVDRLYLVADMGLFQREFNWSPATSLSQGLKLTLEYESII